MNPRLDFTIKKEYKMENVQKGRKQIITIIALTLAVSIFTIIFTNLVSETGRFVVQIIRFYLTLLLCYFLYKGKNWARILMIILLGIATLISIIGIISFIISPILGAVSLLYGSIYGYISYMLIKSKDIKRYIEVVNI